MVKRNVEVFSAGCGACQETIDLVNNIACPSCEITVHDMHDAAVAARAKSLGIRSVPAVIVDGKLADCCAGRGPTEAALRHAGGRRASMTTNEAQTVAQRERLLRVLAAATFLIFFQAYMIAPLLPALALEFGVSAQAVGLAVPAYLIPYGASTLAYGLLSDRLGRRRLVLASLVTFIVLLALTATSRSSTQLIVWRLLAGVGASAVVPLSLVVVGTLYPYEQRGRPLGWLFGAMAGGMAFGSTFGAVLEPVIGWRTTFVAVAALAAILLAFLLPSRRMLGEVPPESPQLGTMLRGYAELLSSERGRRTYAYVFLNAVFHSGVFTWLGLYFKQRFGLGETGIGLAILGYGVPGFLFGPVIGRAADRWGRAHVLPLGLLVSAAAGAALMPALPLVPAAIVVTLLSLGYDMTQPMFAGIVTALGGKRPGQAMGLNVFMLFVGFGVGSLVFGEIVRGGWGAALGSFAGVELLIALAGFRLFRSEVVGAPK